MIFTETKLAGAFIVDLERREDERGWFARMFCQREFAEHGLNPSLAQANVAFNRRRGTLRGMHFQYPPSAEAKYVRCTRGAIVDVLVDLRPESPTFGEHVAVELNEENGRGVVIPKRFAHGYQVLRDETETTYLVDEFYAPDDESGLLYDDPALGIDWPLPVTEMSPKDQAWRPFAEVEESLRERMRAVSA
jgi:dTDP-4-dehydrorhamnose 3,5-epimerase